MFEVYEASYINKEHFWTEMRKFNTIQEARKWICFLIKSSQDAAKYNNLKIQIEKIGRKFKISVPKSGFVTDKYLYIRKVQ